MKIICLSLALLFLCSGPINSQDLLELLNEEVSSEKEFVSGTFKATRLVNCHSVETIGEKQLLFLISHRFESIEKGFYDLFGIDNSVVRFGFEYGVYDRLNIGIGRSNYHKFYDGFLKYNLIKQSKGPGSFPLSVTLFSSMAVNTEKFIAETPGFQTKHRLNYVYQAFIARKMNTSISLQLVPTIVHRNLVDIRSDANTVMALGAGGRFKITKRFTTNIEYFALMPDQIDPAYHNMLSLGFDIETGGHVFQLIFSNSRGIIEKTMIPETTGKWLDTNIHFGFNITRFFSTNNKHE